MFAQGEVIDALEIAVATPQIASETIGPGLGKGVDEAFQCKGLECDTVERSNRT